MKYRCKANLKKTTRTHLQKAFRFALYT